MKRSYSFALAFAFLPFIWAAACNDDQPAAPTTSTALPPDVEALRNSLSAFSSLTLAKNAGFNTMLTDCMSNGDIGAMGVHFANTTRIDGVPEPLKPEALIYEPGTNGEMSLVGVEFIVPFAAVPKTAAPPMLFGQKFSPNDDFGVWGLHVWTHRNNPSGLFASWNPRVHC